MPRSISTQLRTWLDEVPLLESHSTLYVDLPHSGGEYFWATMLLQVDGSDYRGYLKSVGELKLSMSQAADRVEVVLDNSDDTIGGLFLTSSDALRDSRVRVGRVYFNPFAPNESEHVELFSGTIINAIVLDSEVRLSIVSDLYAGGQVGGTRLVLRPCQFTFKDAATCAYTGGETECNKLFDDPDGCSGRSNQHHYGGALFINNKSSNSASVQGPPAVNQLVKISGTAFKQRTSINFVAGSASAADNEANDTTDITVIGTGGKFLENNDTPVTNRNVINIPPYHPFEWVDDAPGLQTNLKAVQLETAVRNLVTDYGADPLGIDDCAAAFAAAIADQGRIIVPAGTYKLDSTVTLPAVDENYAFILEGQNAGNTLINYTGTGNAFDVEDGASGYWSLRNLRIVCTQPSTNTGNGIQLTGGATAVVTHVHLEKVSVYNFGRWGLTCDNIQSSLIEGCHFRGNKSGHIKMVDPDDVDPVKEPNANVISECLLDNSPTDDFNVASIHLFNANNTRITGCTIQGNYSGTTGRVHAIKAEHCDSLQIDGLWVENLPVGDDASAVYLKNCRAAQVDGYHGSGLHNWDFELEDCRGVTFRACTLTNSVPHFVTSNTFDVAVYGSVLSHPENVVQSDTTDKIYIHADCHYHANTNRNYKEYAGTNALFTGWGENWMANPNLNEDTNGWTFDATYVARVATGNPNGFGGYWLYSPGAGSGTLAGLTPLQQSVSVPDAVIAGFWTFSWDYYIENDGAADDINAQVGVGIFATGQSVEYTVPFENQVDNVWPVGQWRRHSVSVYLPAGTSRVLRWRINPDETYKGPNTPTIRFANFRLAPGREAQPGGHLLLSEERTNILRGADGLQFASRPSAAAPASGYGAWRFTGSAYEIYLSGSWQSLSTGAGITALTGDVTATGPGSVAATIANNAVTDAKLRDAAALSVIGRSANSTGDPADIAAGSDGDVLRRSGTTLGFGTIATAGIANDAVTDAKLRNSIALSVIGRASNSTGDPADIAAANDDEVLRRSGITLGFGTVATGGITNNAITNAKLATIATARIKGRVTAGTGNVEDLTGTQATTLLDAVVGDSGAGGAKGLVPAPAAGDAAASRFLKADGTWAIPAGTGITALTGDVTASGSGSVVATIANNAVTLAKMAQVATARFLGRVTASTGNVEALTVTQATAMLDAFVGDSGAGGTKGLVPAPASGDAAAGKYLDADGTWSAPPGTAGITALTGDVTATGPGSVAATIANNAVSNAKLRDSAALSVIGRSANSTGDPADIAAGSDGDVLRRSGTTLGFGQIATAGITDDAVTFAKIQNLTTDRLLGRDTAATGDVEEIAVAGSLIFTGSTSIQLSGDASSPGNSKYYGTNSGGTKGWYDLSNAVTFANPTASVGLTAVNGSATTAMRSDAAPALSQAIAPTWSALHTFNLGTTPSNVILLDIAAIGSAGTRDSHNLIWRGRSDDGSAHLTEWRAFNDVTSNAGASTWTLQSRIDAGSFATRFSVTDGGAVTATSFAGDGSALTSLNASNLASGTIPAGRMPALTGDVTTSAGSVATTIANDAVTDAKLRNSAALSVIGRSANSTGDPADIAAGSDGDVLRRSGATLGFGTIATAGLGANIVTNAKLAQMATARFKGRITAGTGDPEDLTGTQATTLLDVVVGDSGAGGTKGLVPAPATGDAAAGKYLKADGVWTAPPGASAITALTGDVTATGPGSVAATIANNAVSDAKLRDSAALSVIGRSANSTGDPADIAAGSDGDVLRRSGTTLGFGQIATAGITDDAVTFAKIQNITTDRLLGRDTAATGNVEEIALAGSLVFTGSTSIQLSGDSGAPGNSKYYGTDSGGTKGFFDLPTVSFANPTATIGLSVVNGSASTAMRSDAAPALSQSIAPTWTGLHTFNLGTTPSNVILLDIAAIGSAGTRDSHNIVLRGRSDDGSAHLTEWRFFNDVTSNAGASTFTLQSRIDAASFASRLTVNDGGAVTATSFAGDGSALTSLNASNLASGTIPAGRMPALTGDVTTSAGSVATTIANNAVSDAKLRDSAALSVIGRSANSTGDPADIAAANDGEVLRRSGATLGFGTVSTAGIGDNQVTNAKLAQVATATFLGRTTAGTGNVEVLTATQATALLNNLVGDSGSGGTKGLAPAPASGDAAAGKYLKADGTWVVPPGTGITALTGDVTASGSGSVAATIANNAVTDAKLRDSAALSVIGRSANSTGDPADIAAGSDGDVLRRSGTTLGFGTIATAGLGANIVTNAKLAQMATARIKGRVTAGTGDPEDLTGTQATTLLDAVVGDSGSGGTKGLVPAPGVGDASAGKYLKADGTWTTPGGEAAITSLLGDVTGTGPGATVTIIGSNKVTLAKMATVATSRFLGRVTAGTGNVEALTGTQATTLLDAFTGDSGAGGVKGLVPAPAAGDAAAGKFLKANGSWVAIAESINVKNNPYNAVGDGVADDTSAIAAAITAAATLGRRVYLPAGTYKITSALTLPSNVWLFGEGDGSIITGSFSGNLISISASSTGARVNDIKTAGAHQTAISVGIGATNVVIRDCTFTGCTAHTTSVTTTTVLLLGQNSDIWIQNNTFTGNGNLHAADDGADIMVSASLTPFNYRIHVLGNRISGGASRFSVAAFDVFDSEFSGNTIDQNNQMAASTPANISGYGIVVYSTVNTGVIKRNKIAENQIKNSAGSGIYLVNCFHSVVTGNTLEDTCKQQVDGTLPVAAISLNGGDYSTVDSNVITKTTTGNGIGLTGNYATTTLTAQLNAAATTLNTNTTIYGVVGDKIVVTIDSEQIVGTISSATQMNSLIRGAYGTSDVLHTNGSTVRQSGPTHIVCSNNTIRAVAGNAAIAFRNICNGVVVQANDVSDSTIGVLLTTGIILNDAQIVNNQFDRCSGHAINIETANDCLFASNRIKDPSSHGILIQDGLRNIILGNSVNLAVTGFDIRSDDSIIASNEALSCTTGFDDSGSRNVYRDNKPVSCTTASTFAAGKTSQQIKITSGATPDLSAADFFILEYASPTTITNFTGMSALDGAKVLLAMNGNATIQGAGAISLRGNVNFAMAQYDVLVIGYQAGVYELARKTAVNPVFGSQFIAGAQTYGTDIEVVKSAAAVQHVMRNTLATGFTTLGLKNDDATKDFAMTLLNSSYASAVLSGPSTGPSANLYTSGALDLHIGTNGVRRLSFSSAGAMTLALGSDATGDIYYRNSSGNFARLGIGTSNYVLAVTSGIPAWVDVNTLITGGGANTALSNLASVAVNTHLLFGSDNTHDIGASAATRPRSIYAGTDITAGSNLKGTRVILGTDTYGQPLEVIKSAASVLGVIDNASTTGYAGWRVYNSADRSVGLEYTGASYSGSFLTSGPSGEAAHLYTSGNISLVLGTNNRCRLTISGSGHTLPATSGDLDLGGVSNAFRKIHSDHFVGEGSTSFTPGTGAGTGPDVSYTGNATSGLLMVTTGSSPAANATIVTAEHFNSAPALKVAVICPANAAAASLTGSQVPFVSGSDGNSLEWVLKSGSTGLAASTTYHWHYIMIMH